MATVVEACRVSPPPCAGTESTVPLSFFDIAWLHYHPIRRLLFYAHPACTKLDFVQTIVPNLKQSLSLTLRHYLTFSGNLVYPPPDEMPVFRFTPGDSVSLTFAESDHDFDHLVGNHARDSDTFYHLVPELPRVKDEDHGYQTVPVIALRVTLFLGRGLCFSYAYQHSHGDESSIYLFMRAWASISKNGGDSKEFLPIFDRSIFKDYLELDRNHWMMLGQVRLESSSFPLPTKRVRATFSLRRSDIERLKRLVLGGGGGVSSFVVTVSYVWTCLVKSGEDGPESICFAVDLRGRMDPPVPENYVGNCLSFVLAKIERGQLAGEGGFAAAAEAVAEGIKKRLGNNVLSGAENWLSDLGVLAGSTVFGVSGSPKFDMAGADFGWGRARKLEVVSIDGESYSMSLCKSDYCQGGLEVGLSLPKERMEAFSAIFAALIRD